MSAPLTQLIAERGKTLENVGIKAGKIEAELVFCHILGVSRVQLYLHGEELLDDHALAQIDDIIKRRATRYPLQYIIEKSWFYGREFFVSPAVMIPTPETELLCERAIKFARFRQLEAPRVLDLGTGSGVIAVTLAGEIPKAKVVALDLSDEALKVAIGNAEKNNVRDRIDFRASDMFDALSDDERFDLILSNPPYIAEPDYEGLPPEVLADPKLALTSGNEGLDAINVILKEGPDHLGPNGRILFEIGYDQAEKIAELTAAADRYRSIDIFRDYNDIDRIVMLACTDPE